MTKPIYLAALLVAVAGCTEPKITFKKTGQYEHGATWTAEESVPVACNEDSATVHRDGDVDAAMRTLPKAEIDWDTQPNQPAAVRRSNCRFIGGTHAMDYAIYETCLFSDCTVSGKSIAKSSVFRNCDTSGLGDMIDCDIVAEPLKSQPNESEVQR
jgi:hypothetical protein